VRKYLARAGRIRLSWPLPEQLDAAVIEGRLFNRTDDGARSDRPEPDWLEVHREHKRGKHVTLQLLHFEYKQAHPDGLGYTQFCRLSCAALKCSSPAPSCIEATVSRLPHESGEGRMGADQNGRRSRGDYNRRHLEEWVGSRTSLAVVFEFPQMQA
jgi:hypothetical protein